MKLTSALYKDIRSLKTDSGAYEWWYFDAVSDDGNTELVIIFYEGNPFSRRYISRQQKGEAAKAEDFPAISISIYQNKEPIYYSFTEVPKKQAAFREDEPYVQISNHSMQGREEEGKRLYTLKLDEQLPSGDAIEGQLLFESSCTDHQIQNGQDDGIHEHRWDILQSRARVSGQIQCRVPGEKPNIIKFEGQGYHDHNEGSEPLKQQFEDWYWGRFHFEHATLVYYLKGKESGEPCGWLIENDGGEMLQIFDTIKAEDSSLSLYGLQTARKLRLSSDSAEVLVQQSHLIDNGPFYQRFSSEAFLNVSSINRLKSSSGITEYLCPPRIYHRRYWPLTNMRIRYKKESPHWVQRSKTLYRWTW